MSTANPPPWDEPAIDLAAAARLRKAEQVRRYRAARDPEPDTYVTPFTTTYPDGSVVRTWAIVSESPSGDSANIWHFQTKEEAVAAALAMGIKL
jgi:hypothetical protein